MVRSKFAKPTTYWWWLYNKVDKEGITRDLEEFKAKGLHGVNLMCNGGYAGLEPLLPNITWWEQSADNGRAIQTKGNKLEIDVINLWTNRVVGDLNLPKEERFTTTHDNFRFDMTTGKTPLLESGLLGPVQLVFIP